MAKSSRRPDGPSSTSSTRQFCFGRLKTRSWTATLLPSTRCVVVLVVVFWSSLGSCVRRNKLTAGLRGSQMGLFLSIGPLSVFISSHGIPPDIKFDPSSNPPAYVSEDQSVKIEKGSTVRCRIIGTRIDATEFVRFPQRFSFRQEASDLGTLVCRWHY